MDSVPLRYGRRRRLACALCPSQVRRAHSRAIDLVDDRLQPSLARSMRCDETFKSPPYDRAEERVGGCKLCFVSKESVDRLPARMSPPVRFGLRLPSPLSESKTKVDRSGRQESLDGHCNKEFVPEGVSLETRKVVRGQRGCWREGSTVVGRKIESDIDLDWGL